MKIYAQKEGIFICGKVKEVRYLLSAYTSRYRTIKELLAQLLN